MPQLSLYLDETTMQTVRESAARSGMTLSKYVADVLHEQQDTSRLWPQGFFDLYGSCEDLTEPADTPYDLDPLPALDLE